MLEKAILPLNLSESESDNNYLLAFLYELGSRHLHLAYVTDANVGEASSRRRQLDRIATRAADQGFQTQVDIRSGHAATAICGLADQTGAGLIAFPWRKQDLMHRALFGSVAADVVRLSGHPVLIARKGLTDSPIHPLRTVLYATAFEMTDRQVMPYLRQPELQAETLYLLHVAQRAPDPHAEELRQQRVQQKLDVLAQECADQYQSVEQLAFIGSVRRQIIRQARKHDADLIVIGKYDKGGPLRKMTGSTAQHLVHRSPCSLLIIPKAV